MNDVPFIEFNLIEWMVRLVNEMRRGARSKLRSQRDQSEIQNKIKYFILLTGVRNDPHLAALPPQVLVGRAKASGEKQVNS